jgi:hypothetical protein
MIRQENGNWVAYCDGDCGASVNTGVRSFQQAVNYLSRAERWDSRKYRDLWFNYCPSCGEYGRPEIDRTGLHFTRKIISDDDY